MKKFTLGFIILSVVILQGCGSDAPHHHFNRSHGQNNATSVETSKVSEKPISKQITAFGTVKAKDVVQVTPQVSNRITHIYAQLGDTVKEGQPLAKIYDAPYQDQVQQAKAQVSQNRATFEQDSAAYARQQKLYKRDLISKSTLEQAEATYKNSKSQLQSSIANLTQSKENLKNTVIRSPVYGVVINRNVAQGDLASSGQVAYEIGNLTGYQTYVYLPMQEWREVKIGQKVHFDLSDGERSSAIGRVSRISPRLDPQTGLGKVVVTFTKKGPSISQGLLVKSIINVETHPNAIVIPRSALVENVKTVIQPESNAIQTERTYSAFVVQGDSLALKHSLTLGIDQGDKVEVVKGLQAGDEIVTTGQENLEDSSRVRVANMNMFKNRSVTLGNGEDSSGTSNMDSNGNSSKPNN